MQIALIRLGLIRLGLITGFVLCSAICSLAQNDLKISVKNSFGSQSIQSTTYIKGTRERSEQVLPGGMNIRLATIQQCDLKRQVEISDSAKKYVITPFATGDDNAGAAAAKPSPAARPTPPPAGPVRKGGVVTYVMTITDTGERKQMFGYTARHIKTSTSIESSPDACNQQKTGFEADGWYIDFQAGFSCSTERPPVVPRNPQAAARTGCQDQVKFRRVGTAKLGYPALVTTRILGSDGQVQTTYTQEIVELSTAKLDPALFDIPDGYAQAQNTSEFYGAPSRADIAAMMARRGNNGGNNASNNAAGATESANNAGGKRAGVILIGVADFNNKSGQTVADSLRSNLVAEIDGNGVEAIALDATDSKDVEAEAKRRGCDYILYTDITSLKPASAAKKIGGLLGRATGQSTLGIGKSEGRVDFRLVPIAGGSSILTSSTTGKEDTDEATLNAALTQEARQVAEAARKRK